MVQLKQICKQAKLQLVYFTLFSYSYFYKTGLLDRNVLMKPIDFHIRNNRPNYSLQNEQAQLSYKLYQVHNNNHKLYDAIQNKKIAINQQKEFNYKIEEIIKSKQITLSNHHQSCQVLDQEINFYQQYLQNLNDSISQLKTKLDEELQGYLHLNAKSMSVKLENDIMETLSLKDLLGSKCRFTPHVMNYSWQIQVEKHDQQLQIWKTNDQPLYILAYNYHPLKSKGILHFSLAVQFSYQPKFLLGISNLKNISDNSMHIYFNSQTMQIQKNGEQICRVQGQINNHSKITIVINCNVWLFFVIVDQVLLCRADLNQIKDQYLYFFVGLTCSDTVLKFDHSLG